MAELTSIECQPIGWVRGGREQATKDGWGGNRCRLELRADRFGPEALAGVAELSHLEVLFWFHIDADEAVATGARHPRGNTDWPQVGIFAQRGRMRPNRIGVSYCKVIGVDGLTIEVEDLDAVDGTPLLDLKPVWRETLPRGEIRQPDWASELMSRYY